MSDSQRQNSSQIEDHNLVSFLPLDITQEDSVNAILSHIDNGMQYGEDEEPRAPDDLDQGEPPQVYDTKSCPSTHLPFSRYLTGDFAEMDD
jgi:hypothetical protein